jgi:thioesterase III
LNNKVTQIKVRGYHLDLYSHVNNARYLEFLEEARWNYYEGLYEQNTEIMEGKAFLIVNININYRYPAALGDILDITISVKHVGNKSVVLHQEIFLENKGTMIVDADVTFVITDISSGKAIPMEGRLREIFADINE